MRAAHALGTIAVIAVAGLALQGCSAAAPSDGGSSGALDGKGKTLTMMVAANGLYPEQQKAWFQDVSDRFEKETGAKVSFETFASANDELTKIQTSVVSGQGPDIYGLGTTFTPTASATGAFVTLDDAAWDKVGGRDRFVPATLGISGPDKQHEVGIPFASRPFVMAYNKDLLAAAGIDKPATTWDELGEQAAKLTSGDTYGLAIAYADSFDPWKFIWGMSIQAGNPILDGKKAQIDDAATKKAYEAYFGWMTKEKAVDPAAVGWKNAQAVAAFASGKAAYLPMTSATSKVTLDASGVAGKYAYALLPTVPPGEASTPKDGKPATSIISGDNLVVAKYSQNQDLAFALIKMLTSEESQTSYFTTFGELPTNAAAAKALETDNADLAPIVESSAGSVGTPFSGAWGDTQLALVNVVVQLIPELSAGDVSDASLESQLKTAQTAAQSALDKVK
ncbi:extracellular solute-binding protein [Plantibacter sp. YIM 135347]|uniref:ABC transporter substrate-binding protein n=1 Tax=Plantibacter sp. YIM 135347 TaxID=3423919 RepID=UPI003D3568BE